MTNIFNSLLKYIYICIWICIRIYIQYKYSIYMYLIKIYFIDLKVNFDIVKITMWLVKNLSKIRTSKNDRYLQLCLTHHTSISDIQYDITDFTAPFKHLFIRFIYLFIYVLAFTLQISALHFHIVKRVTPDIYNYIMTCQ